MTVSSLVALALISAPVFTAPDRWTAAQTPYQIHGDSYYVGSVGLAAILITGDDGHVLVDVPMDQNVAPLLQNIRALGFEPNDIHTIVFSHAHFDHAGGAARMIAATGAQVYASAAQAVALRSGGIDPKDPQFGMAGNFPAVTNVQVYADGEAVSVGAVRLIGHATPGHTPGSTTWSWRSCEQDHCINMVYADSLTAIGSDSYQYSDPKYPERLQDFRAGLQSIAELPCDLLISPHPEASDYDKRRKRQLAGEPHALLDKNACRTYAEKAGKRLNRVIERERAASAEPS